MYNMYQKSNYSSKMYVNIDAKYVIFIRLQSLIVINIYYFTLGKNSK